MPVGIYPIWSKQRDISIYTIDYFGEDDIMKWDISSFFENF